MDDGLLGLTLLNSIANLLNVSFELFRCALDLELQGCLDLAVPQPDRWRRRVLFRRRLGIVVGLLLAGFAFFESDAFLELMLGLESVFSDRTFRDLLRLASTLLFPVAGFLTVFVSCALGLFEHRGDEQISEPRRAVRDGRRVSNPRRKFQTRLRETRLEGYIDRHQTAPQVK